MRHSQSVHERVPARPLAHGVPDLDRDSLDVSTIRAIDADGRGVPSDAPTRITVRLLDADSHWLYASRWITTACQERMDIVPARGGLCSKAGLVDCNN
jgi:hypothetical protein